MNTHLFRLMILLGVRNARRNPRRSFLTILAIAVGVWSALSMSALARGMSGRLMNDAIVNLTGHIQIHAKHYLDDPVVEHSFALGSELNLALTDKKIKQWSTRVRVPAVIMSEQESVGVTLVGIDPQKEKGLSFISDSVIRGSYFADDNDKGIIIGEKLARILETDLGKRVVLMSEDVADKVSDRGFRVTGIFRAELETTEKSFVFVARQAAQTMLGLGNNISEIAMLGADMSDTDYLVSKIKHGSRDLVVSPWQDLEPLVTAVLNVQNGFLRLWYVIVVVTIAFGLVNTLFMAIFERIQEIGLLQALGMSGRMIIYQIMCESTLLIFIGTVFGNILCFVTMWLLRDGIDLSSFSKGTEIIGVGHHVYLILRTNDFVLANVMVVVLAIISSLYPAWHASRYEPVEALRHA